MTLLLPVCSRCRLQPGVDDTLLGVLCTTCLNSLAPKCEACGQRDWQQGNYCSACALTLVRSACARRTVEAFTFQIGPFRYCRDQIERSCSCIEHSMCAACRRSLEPYIGRDGVNLCFLNENGQLFCPLCAPNRSGAHCSICGVQSPHTVAMENTVIRPGMLEPAIEHRLLCPPCLPLILRCQSCDVPQLRNTAVFYEVDVEPGIDGLRALLAPENDEGDGVTFVYSHELDLGLCLSCARVCPQCNRLCVLYDGQVCRFCYKYNHHLY